MNLRTRQQAKLNEHPRFFTGKPRLYGHISERYTSFGGCVQCVFERSATDIEKTRLREWQGLPENRRKHAERGWRNRGLPSPTRSKPDNCEICGAPAKHGRGNSLALDHDHETGRFRGWLCINCNHALGKVGDSLVALLDWARKAESYLRKGFD